MEKTSNRRRERRAAVEWTLVLQLGLGGLGIAAASLLLAQCGVPAAARAWLAVPLGAAAGISTWKAFSAKTSIGRGLYKRRKAALADKYAEADEEEG